MQRLRLAIDGSGNLYLGGTYTGSPNVSPNPSRIMRLPAIPSSRDDGFIAKLTPSGKGIWAKTIPLNNGPYSSQIRKLIVSKNHNLYITGNATDRNHSIDFNPGIPVNHLTGHKGGAFVLSWDTSGIFNFVEDFDVPTSYNFVCENGLPMAITIDKYENIYTSGGFVSDFVIDFDPGPGQFLINGSNVTQTEYCGYIWKLGANCPLVVDSVSVSACSHYSLGGRTFDSSGTYAVVLPRAGDTCDSIVVLDLQLSYPDFSVIRHGDTLKATDTNAIGYQWLACDSLGNKTPVPGATDNFLVPPSDGQYTVAVTYEHCTDTGDCITINNLGIEHSPIDKGLKIIPNPAHNKVQVIFDLPVHQVQLRLVNTLGKVVWKADDFSGKATSVDLRKLATGVYYLRVKTDAGMRVEKVVKW